MNAEQLKGLQAPLKERYRKDPAAAVVTLRAQGRIGEGLACRVETGRAPVGFREIRLRFDLDSDASAEQKKKLLELAERYCVVLQTIRNSPPVSASYGA